jgi:hypothetical protein
MGRPDLDAFLAARTPLVEVGRTQTYGVRILLWSLAAAAVAAVNVIIVRAAYLRERGKPMSSRGTAAASAALFLLYFAVALQLP